MVAKCSFARSPLNWDESTSAGTTKGNAIELPSAPSKIAMVKQITKSADSRRSGFTKCMILSIQGNQEQQTITYCYNKVSYSCGVSCSIYVCQQMLNVAHTHTHEHWTLLPYIFRSFFDMNLLLSVVFIQVLKVPVSQVCLFQWSRYEYLQDDGIKMYCTIRYHTGWYCFSMTF